MQHTVDIAKLIENTYYDVEKCGYNFRVVDCRNDEPETSLGVNHCVQIAFYDMPGDIEIYDIEDYYGNIEGANKYLKELFSI